MRAAEPNAAALPASLSAADDAGEAALGAWVLVGATLVAVLVALVAVLAGDQAPGPGAGAGADGEVPAGLAHPDQLRAAGFGQRWYGYDPDEVDAFVDRAARSYGALYAAAGPEAIERARAALGEEPPDRDAAPGTGPGHEPDGG